MKIIEKFSLMLSNSSIKPFLRRLFYNTLFLFPLGYYVFDLLDEPKARFRKFLFCDINDPDMELKGYLDRYRLKQGDIVVDAGSAPGEFTIYASRKIGPKGRVLAFEPDERYYKILVKNIKANGLKNVIPLKLGLWSKKATVDDAGTILDVVTLDEQLKKLGISKINFIKMDVEGAEIEAIKGMQHTLNNKDVNLAIASYHVVDGKKTAGWLEQHLKEKGFMVETGYDKHLTTWAWKDS